MLRLGPQRILPASHCRGWEDDAHSRPTDLSFFDEAPSKVLAEVELDCTPTRLVEIFEDQQTWPK